MIKSLILVISLMAFLQTHSHEGHDHDLDSGQVHAPKGGVIRSLETIHLEFLNKGKTVHIYVYDKDLKSKEVRIFPASATTTLPRKKPQTLTLVDKGDHWEAEFDAKGAHRYTLELSIKQGGHDDKVKFTVEPKK